MDEDEDEERDYRHLPEQNYETDLSTKDFIYFVQDYFQFLRKYINNKYYDDPEEISYLKSFIDLCNEINTDEGNEESFDTYRPTIEPLMEWMTLWAEDMNNFYQQQHLKDVEPKGVAHRTRSKSSATGFEIPPNKRGRNAMTLEPTKQEAVRIKLSDGKEYTYGEIKHMIEWNKNMTPYRHPYNSEDNKKIKDLIGFATKGGKRRTKKRKNKKTKKTRKHKMNQNTRRK
jgi:hypothetical protein